MIIKAFRGAESQTKTLEQVANSIIVQNNGGTLTFTIHDISIEVNGGKTFEGNFAPFDKVVINPTNEKYGDYQVIVKNNNNLLSSCIGNRY